MKHLGGARDRLRGRCVLAAHKHLIQTIGAGFKLFSPRRYGGFMEDNETDIRAALRAIGEHFDAAKAKAESPDEWMQLDNEQREAEQTILRGALKREFGETLDRADLL